jgi:hypothetical protein
MTSIEWLIEQLEQKGDMRETPSIRNLQLNIDTSDYLELKRQAKEMHKKEMIEFAEYVATYPDKNVNVNGDMLHAKSKYDGAERTIDLLEIFKRDKK